MHGLFYKANKGGWVSKLIAFVTRRDRAKDAPPLSHYEHMFNPNTFYSASEVDGCTRFKSSKEIHPDSGNWVKVPIHLKSRQKRRIMDLCKEEEGRDYDTFGAMFWHTPYQNPQKDFCSEQGARHLIEVGYLRESNTKWSPNRLYKELLMIHLIHQKEKMNEL